MAFNVLAAKKEGYSDAEIADYLAQQSNFDAASARQEGYSDKEILAYLNKQDFTFGQAFMAGARAEVGSELTGATQLLGGEATESEVEAENLARQAEEERGVATFLGRAAGGLINPSTLIPGALLYKGVKGLIVGGAAAGATAGFLRPLYEEDDLGRGATALLGAGLGATIGGTAGVIAKRFGSKVDGQVEASPATSKTREEIEAELPSLAPSEDALPVLLSKAPEADQQYVNSVLSRYEVGDEIPYSVVNEIAEKVEDKQLAALFRDLSKPISETAQNKFIPKEEAVNTPMVKAAVESGSEVSAAKAMSETETIALKTGDYRDYLKSSSTRFADIRPEQFARMIDPNNPFKNANVKVLVSKTDEDQDTLQQVYGALEGRMKYERQAGKTFDEITAEGLRNIPEDAAVDALLNKKIQEILPPEVLASAYKATRQAIDDLSNARELARVARERGSEEGYAVLQSMMGKAAGLLAAVEGNASNLGRALAYQKRLNHLISKDQKLVPFLGGRSC
jgi:hypothetical protein